MEKNKRLLLVANVAKEHVLKFHIPTIRMLKENGWQVDVACSGKEQIPFCDEQYHMSYKRSPFTTKTFTGIRELKKIIDNGKYDIVYCHTPVGGLAARVAGYQAHKSGTRIIYMAHGFHFYKGAPLLNWALYYPVEKVLSLVTDDIIVINNEDYCFAKKHFRNCIIHQINGIGVDTARFNLEDRMNKRHLYRQNNSIPDDATVLIYLAELLPNKNQKFLMDTLKEVIQVKPNTYLVLAGFDHSHGSFMQYAEEIGVCDNIRYLGWREDVAELYMMSDICTASSIREGFGLNLVEAMMCGLPVIATRNRGHETIVTDGVNGYLIDLEDVGAFAGRVIQLIDNPKISKSFIANANEELPKYTSDAVLDEIKSIFNHKESKVIL